MTSPTLSRRDAVRLLGFGAAAFALSSRKVSGRSAPTATKVIPSSGRALPAVGLGTWRTFNVGGDPALRDARTEVLRAFFEEGGGLVDSSPMYGSAQEVIGHGLRRLGVPESLFSADKIWTSDGNATRTQAAETAARWGLASFDLLQIHNLAAWEHHLPTLRRMKEEGLVRHLGITTSHGMRHDAFERIMRTEPLDFIQLTYNATHREAERRLLPLAADRGIAVIVNRPFDGGALVTRLKSRQPRPPAWIADFDGRTWADVLLKFVISHPAVTCAIPATTRVDHLRENMAALHGRLPDAAQRERLVRHLESL